MSCMFSRTDFDLACKGFVKKYSENVPRKDGVSPAFLNWSWAEHPRYPGLGYLSRTTILVLKKKDTCDSDVDEVLGDTQLLKDKVSEHLSAVEETVQVNEYVAYSPTFQVPAFYFSMSSASGSPLILSEMLQTPYFVEAPSPDFKQTRFALQAPNAAFPMLSQSDHPTLGTPCWCIHPCETPSALRELVGEGGVLGDDQPSLVRKIELWFLLLGNIVNLR